MSGSVVLCPLCEEGVMEHKELPSENGRGNKTHIYVCNECPGILMEWWDNKDTEAFVKYINREER